METAHQMCRTRNGTADRVRGIKQRELALLRVRGEGQHNTICEVKLDEDRHECRTAHVRGMTSTPQCAMQRRMERCDAALFQIGATKKDRTGSAIIMNYLTTLLDLCMDDKTAQSTQKACNRDTGQNVTRVRKLNRTEKGQAQTE